jgi:hypothetical protein
MLKTIAHMLLGAFFAAAVGAAFAVTGQPPVNGFQTPDGTWLLGLASGLNNTYQSGLTAAGTTQATALQLPAGIYLMEVDTAAASSGVALPPCFQGAETLLYNNGANPIVVYPSITNNLITGVQDTINNGTTLSGNLASHAPEAFFCAKNGVWAAK